MNFLVTILFTIFIAYESRNIDYDIIDYDEEEVFDSYNHMTDLEDYPNVCDNYRSERCAKAWLDTIDPIRKRNANRLSNLGFRYNANITEENGKLKMKFLRRNIIILRKMKEKCRKFKWQHFKSPKTRRIFQLMTPTIQSKDKTISRKLLKISARIKSIYNHARPCYGKCLQKGESDIISVFQNERDYDKLAGFWTAWRNVTGRRIKDLFVERMNLENIGARENGYSDAASFEFNLDFEENNYNESVIRLYEEILPFYKELHGYVRHCLLKVYPGRFDDRGPIPAHILGNVWAQQWHNIMPILQKCEGRTASFSLQNEANSNLKNIPVKKMFKMAETFYTSMGMFPMTKEFWERSLIEKPRDRLADCHGSAYSFVNGADYRIMMCTKQNTNDFTTVHHEMGHIEYYMAYRDLPYAFHGSANPGFHEAIGDTIALAVKTPEHLKKIDLISDVPTSKEFDIDYLMGTALEKIAFLPFALTMDSYLWNVYNGSVPSNELNKHWWDLRYRFQGLKPPSKRTESDFDPAAKYHMAFGRQYIRYFISFLLQFQFYEAMCQLSDHRGPLHRCDFYRSEVAGERMLEMLAKGKSQHWRETLEILTGKRDVSSSSILKFFDPLYKWLKKRNKDLSIPIGW